ncbi:hypothetical protein K458DRAFT_415362 [Lentithecium fluviatile CBS 122367]|uniref:Cora-domain-containing protein n=1 Tax=Lentithecium fluviatile CBS 122367 TaxID=1168545 RepID=A0A6G1JAC3_9PLEO|nr:hypothetical protein K458DRAFT_415362 [Lentithecium fluviatile CBS 122367]
MEKVEVVERTASRKSTWDTELARLVKIDGILDKAEEFRIVFGSAQDLSKSIAKGDKKPNFLSSEFLDSICKDLNGSFGCRYTQNGVVRFKAYSIWYTFKIKQVSTCKRTGQLSYAWDQVACFATCAGDAKNFLVLCLDCPKNVQGRLRDQLRATKPAEMNAWHEALLKSVRDMYDHSVWSLRHCIRDAERGRDALFASLDFQPDFVHLHEIARHAIHSNETLDVAIDTVERILKDFKKRSQTESDGSLDFPNIVSALEKDLRSIKRRSESLQERLQNEINLAFNLVAQRDSRIMVRMGEQSRQDNNNMKSIAVVGLVYLPGTFVSGLFGMNFFDFSDESGHQSWKVSNKLWMYWAISVPLTLATIFFWVMAFHGQSLKWPVFKRKRAGEVASIDGA